MLKRSGILMGESTLQARIRARALELGFAQLGFAPAEPPESAPALSQWLAEGQHGELHYMEKNAEKRRDPRIYWPDARTIIVVTMVYVSPSASGDVGSVSEAVAGPLEGRIARYARCDDYHDVVKALLHQLGAFVQTELPGVRYIPVVDASAVLERAHAVRAGLGWFGKNSMLLSREVGSFTVIGALLLDRMLEPDLPVTAHCGSCTACIDACPTQAIVAPGVVDARKCLSYLSIELRGKVPEPLRQGWRDWVFGCDICQEVCPWVQKAERTGMATLPRLEPAVSSPLQPHAGRAMVSLKGLLLEDDATFRLRWKGSPLKRTKRIGLARNAAILLGSSPDREGAVTLLEQSLTDSSPVVRATSAWALGNQGGAKAREALLQARTRDGRRAMEADAAAPDGTARDDAGRDDAARDDEVCAEIDAALERCS